MDGTSKRGHEEKGQKRGGSVIREWEQIEKEQGGSGTVATSDRVAPGAWLSVHE